MYFVTAPIYIKSGYEVQKSQCTFIRKTLVTPAMQYCKC